MKRDLKSLLLASQSPVLRVLKVSNRVLALPSLVVYLVNRCNYRCFMCPVNDFNQDALEKMELPLLESLLDQAAALPLRPRIHFSGYGEPLVYPHFREVIRLCKERGVHWSITTNGYLLAKYAEDIIAGGCRGINISIHGEPATHDQVVKVRSAFEKTVAGIQRFDALKRAGGTQQPPIAINCVMNHDNVRQLPAILRMFRELPVNSVNFQHLIFSETEMDEQQAFTIQGEPDIQAIIDFKRSVERQPHPIPARFFPSLTEQQIWSYYSDKNYPPENTCTLPWLSTRVYPTGAVALCGVPYGDLHATPLKDLLNSPGARAFREQVRRKGFSSELCFRCCHRQYA